MFNCHNSYAHVMLQYNIMFGLKHLLHFFNHIVCMHAHEVRLVHVYCLVEYHVSTPVNSTLSGLVESNRKYVDTAEFQVLFDPFV